MAGEHLEYSAPSRLNAFWSQATTRQTTGLGGGDPRKETKRQGGTRCISGNGRGPRRSGGAVSTACGFVMALRLITFPMHGTPALGRDWPLPDLWPKICTNASCPPNCVSASQCAAAPNGPARAWCLLISAARGFRVQLTASPCLCPVALLKASADLISGDRESSWLRKVTHHSISCDWRRRTLNSTSGQCILSTAWERILGQHTECVTGSYQWVRTAAQFLTAVATTDSCYFLETGQMRHALNTAPGYSHIRRTVLCNQFRLRGPTNDKNLPPLSLFSCMKLKTPESVIFLSLPAAF